MDRENETKVAISHCALCEDSNFIYRDCLLAAATAMRDKYVEKVKASGAYWREVSKKFQRGDEEFAFFTAKAKAADDLERELESLTLDQVKPGEM